MQMTNNIEIALKIGLNELKFGLTPDEVLKILGTPDEKEKLQEEGRDTEMWFYDEDGITVFFEKFEKMRCVLLETENENTFLFGNKIFELKEKAIKDLFLLNGYSNFLEEIETWGEKRLSVDDALLDIYFEKNKVVAISWGVDYDDNKPLWSSL